MAKEQNNNQNEEKKRSFVREHIVPRKNTKKIILTILSTIGLALLFGAIAGVAFFVSQDIMDANSPTAAPPPVSISRDESNPAGQVTVFPDLTTQAPGESGLPSSETPSGESESQDLFPPADTGTEASETDPAETTGEPSGEGTTEAPATDPGEKETVQPSGQEGSSGGTDPIETESETETETETSVPTLLEIYKQIRNGFVGITISTPAGTDVFGNPVYETQNTFGAVITETEDDFYVLYDGTGLAENGIATAYLDGTILESEQMGTDSLNGLSVLRLPKNEQSSPLTVIPLGNSNLTVTADTVYQFGYQMGEFIAMDQGVVSYISAYENFLDGYRTMIYTGMQRKAGTFSLLVNQSGEIIGLIGDRVSAEGSMAVARGISSVKYLIDDLCSGRDTAYIGLKGRVVSNEEAASSRRPAGFYIQSLEENSPAYRSGLQPGDRILSFNEQPVSHSFGLQLQIDELSPGSEVRIQIARAGADGREMMLLYRFLAGTR